MKLLFICGSLEPGLDGVGDYTRMLAGELIQNGHQAAAVAINDKHIVETLEGSQEVAGAFIPVLRLTEGWSSKKRFKYAKKWLDDFDPDWISLQFVPFSFHTKGISIKFNHFLKILGKGRNWHVMFHELWVGMDQNANLKLVWWGRFQRLLIQCLLHHIKPKAIHTQSRLYQLQLEKIGVEVGFLPLFSNIPLIDFNLSLSESLENLATQKTIIFVLFGGIHPGAPVEKFAREAAFYAKKNHKKLILKIVGRAGMEQEDWASAWKSAGLEVELIGEQPAEKISVILRSASFGISTTPMALVEKSGSVAAMKEHGLPVLCVANTWHPRGITDFNLSTDIIDYQKTNLEKLFIKEKASFSTHSNLSDISRQLVDVLLLKLKEK